MTLVVRAHGGASSIGRNPWTFLKGVLVGASPIGLNSMDLVVRVHGGASIKGRNST